MINNKQFSNTHTIHSASLKPDSCQKLSSSVPGYAYLTTLTFMGGYEQGGRSCHSGWLRNPLRVPTEQELLQNLLHQWSRSSRNGKRSRERPTRNILPLELQVFAYYNMMWVFFFLVCSKCGLVIFMC